MTRIRLTACIALGTLLILAPLPSAFGFMGTDKAEAAKGGNGKGKGNGIGNAAAAGSGAQAGNGATASSLGALNAAHASPSAFLHASTNSRVGRIRAYREQAIEAAALADAAEAAGMVAAEAQAAIDQANDDLANGVIDQPTYDAIVEQAQADIDASATALADAEAAEAEAVELLNAAANKTPVSEETRAALDQLLEAK